MTISNIKTTSRFNTIKKPAAAALAIAMIASTSMVAFTTDAEAGKKKRRAAGAFIGGLIVGGALAAGSRHSHGGHYHSGHSHGYVEDCWTEKRVYWKHGHRRVRYVEVCS